MLLGFLFYVASFILTFDIVNVFSVNETMEFLSFSKNLNPDQLYYLHHLFICHSSFRYRQYHIFIYRSLCYITCSKIYVIIKCCQCIFVKWIFNGTSLFLNNLKLKQHYLLIFFWKKGTFTTWMNEFGPSPQ